MKLSLARLIDHFNEPFDSVERYLSRFHYDSIKLKRVDMVRNDTLPVRWLNDSTFILDTMALEKEPFLIQKTVIRKVLFRSALISEFNLTYMMGTMADSLLRDRDSLLQGLDTLLLGQDTLTGVSIDSAFLESMEIRMYNIPGSIHPSARFTSDSGRIIVSDTIEAIVADRESPFYIVPGERMPDSLRHAVETLLAYTVRRDSILVFLNDVQGHRTPLWLSVGKDELYRYWVKNYNNDSITIWMGNPAKYDISLVLEEDLHVERMEKEGVDDIPIIRVSPEMSLAKIQPLEEIPVYWDYGFSTSFGLNQTYLSNWSKGGENSLSGLLDINGTAIYTNTEGKTQWTNAARLNYGTIITEENGLRTNTDLFELDSKYNRVIKEKIDFSASFYMKNQIAKGYNYPNDSVVISKFLNPGTFTIGLGVEYKPFKHTTINFSPLSYKNTFVLDTANIDQTNHGIAGDKRAKQEMGGQLVMKNKVNILSDLNISSSLRLFSNYLNKPQNIDVDWEIDLKQRINWYFTVALNLHLIYDDDIRFAVLDEDDQPVLWPDGSAKKVPKLQFKQFLGFSFLFSF